MFKLLSFIPFETSINAIPTFNSFEFVKNNGLKTTLILTNVLLWIGLIVLILILKYSCGYELNVKSLFLENAIVFMGNLNFTGLN